MSKILAALDASAASLADQRRGRSPRSISEEVKTLRGDLGLSQREFAETFGIPLASIHTWESPAKKGNPDLAARLLIDMIKIDPKTVADLVRRTKLARLEKPLLVDA